MRFLRCVVFGLGMACFFGLACLCRNDAVPVLGWQLPAAGAVLPCVTLGPAINNPARLLGAAYWPLIAAWGTVAVLSLVLASNLKRTPVDWLLLTGIFPFLAPQLLACLQPAEKPLTSGLVLRVLAAVAGLSCLLAFVYAIDRGSVQELADGFRRIDAAFRPAAPVGIPVADSEAAAGQVPVQAPSAALNVAEDRTDVALRQFNDDFGRNPNLMRWLHTWAAALLMTSWLAAFLRRGIFDWTAFALPAPFLAPVILACLGKHDERERSVVAARILSFTVGLAWFCGLVLLAAQPIAVIDRLSLPPFSSLAVGLWILTVFCAGVVARMTGYSFAQAAGLALLMPFLTPMVVALQESRQYPRKPALDWRMFWRQWMLAFVSLGKSCSNCRKPVPIWSKAGQTCPHCRVFWSREVTTVVKRNL